MKITAHQRKIKVIRSDDPDFTIYDSVVASPRAGFEISDACPSDWKYIIVTAMQKGYLKPVAYVYGKELTMDALR